MNGGVEQSEGEVKRREPKHHRRTTYIDLANQRAVLSDLEGQKRKIEREINLQEARVKELELDAREWLDRDERSFVIVDISPRQPALQAKMLLLLEKRDYSIITRIIEETK